MRNDRLILASTLTPCPIRKRRHRNELLRGVAVGLALEAVVALAIVGVVWNLVTG